MYFASQFIEINVQVIQENEYYRVHSFTISFPLLGNPKRCKTTLSKHFVENFCSLILFFSKTLQILKFEAILIRQVRSITRFPLDERSIRVHGRQVRAIRYESSDAAVDSHGAREVANAANWSPISLPLAMQPTQRHSERVRANILRPSEQSRRSSREY